MRIKSKKGMEKRILDSNRYVKDPYDYRDRWNGYFNNENDIHMELGMGRGAFLVELAGRNPDINYIGVEKYLLVIARAAGKLENTQIDNVALLVEDINNILGFVEDESIGRIYLNFLDPWPKKKHEKRRCTSIAYLNKYRQVLKQSGEIHFKTDDENFYTYTLESLQKASFDISFFTGDLYSTRYANTNIATEYEKKFLEKGVKIKKIIARRN